MFNAFLSHKYAPAAMIKRKVTPVVKSNSSGKCDSANYRPVVNSANLSKVFEYCLMPNLSKHLLFVILVKDLKFIVQ